MKIFCVGRNYSLHAKELGNDVPTEPVIFLKPETALLRTGHPFFIPPFSNEIHYETEVVLRICRVGKGISPEFALRYVDKVSVGIDFTARDLQDKLKSKGLPWEISKGFDGSAALGEWVDTENLNLDQLDFSLLLNNQNAQIGNTKDMLFSIANIISYISNFYTIKIGDLIYTGTPAGVAKVNPGDTLEAFLGQQRVLNMKIK
jgi:2-keto-4-pentenoate hydratase/2-oxohepta-3-ene-1,7-dioic acid hydratase in catechol pathway